MIDLHTHSRCSDGQDTPEELVSAAAAAGVTVMALTDHDTINGLPAAQTAAEKHHIKLIPGIEISVQGGRELHILGYGVRPDDEGLQAFYRENQSFRRQRRDRLLDMLNKAGIPITLEDICRVNNGKSSGRPHFARTLVELGYADSVQDAFDKYLATPSFYQIERPKPLAWEGIAMIQRAGGVAVLAHPYTLKLEEAPFRSLLEELISYGLRGIESYYSKHTPEEIACYTALAEEYGLLCTCGSDYHGAAVKPDILLGSGCQNSLLEAGVPEEEILSRLYEEMEKAKHLL
ncbi:MAG: PHP domain-containing protein [Ruminococcus sp.]|nr:PHP domain-containing protein [Ruminococcus sp.]